MLLGNKKKQGEEQNWSIVLSNLANEIDKKRISRRISEIFSLSMEEASDLVCNTPIILLDNLTHSDATKIREFFRTEGADVIMTNDIFFKRKCYRTVWPEPPNLTFLQTPKAPRPAALPASKEQPLNTEEALKELRSMRPSPSAEQHRPIGAQPPQNGEKEKGKILRELEAWRKESYGRKEEMEKLKQALDSTKGNLSYLENEKKAQDLSAQDREKQLAEFRAQLSSAAEKYEALREEYKKSRMLYEERLSAARAEKEGVQAYLKQTEEKLRSIEDVNRGLRVSLERLPGKQTDAVSSEEVQALKSKAAALESELAALKGGREPAANKDMERRLQDAMAQIEALNKVRTELEKQSRGHEAELKLRIDEKTTVFQQRVASLEAERNALSADLQRQSAEKSALKSEQEFYTGRLHEMERSLEEASHQGQLLRGELDQARRALEESLERIRKMEAESASRIANEKEKRDLLELKLKASSDEMDHLRSGLEELTAEAMRLQQVTKDLESSLNASRSSEKEFKAKFESLGQKYNQLIAQYDMDKLELLKAQDALREAESNNSISRKETEELRTVKSHLESRLNSAETKLQDLEKKSYFNDTVRAQLIAELEQTRSLLQQKKEEADSLSEIVEQTRLKLEKTQDDANSMAARLRETEERMNAEAQRREAEAGRREAAFADLNSRYEEASARLRELQETAVRDREEMARMSHLLEQRERDLEGLRRQLRDINQQMEQRETLLKRNQIVAELTEKENQLKRMIEDQSRIENEIKEREDMMRLILKRQEEIEKEIISGKQAQRHLLEQVKKERPGASRFSKYEKKETDEA
jgi:chromosome segregation ATPase